MVAGGGFAATGKVSFDERTPAGVLEIRRIDARLRRPVGVRRKCPHGPVAARRCHRLTSGAPGVYLPLLERYASAAGSLHANRDAAPEIGFTRRPGRFEQREGCTLRP
jgi:hypothetical protein